MSSELWRHLGRLNASRNRLTAAAGIVAASAALLTIGLWRSEAADPSVRSLIGAGILGAEGRAAFVPEVDASRVMGAESCKKCHESEFHAWERTVHFKNHERITSDAGTRYIQAYGSSDACYTCHSTPQPAGSDTVVGVSCESCHTPAGGDGGWFAIHSDYGHGPGMMTDDWRNEEEAHRETRLAACKEAGMIRASNVYELARNCYSCHIVGDEKLLESGHKPGQSAFDLLSWVRGEVRHNFQRNQQVNAESPSLLADRAGIGADQQKRILLVVGKLVELEVCLRNLAAVSEDKLRSDYARGWADRADDAKDFLDEELLSQVQDEDLQAAFDAVEPIRLGRRFKDQEAAAGAAESVAEAARSFVSRHDGSELAALDALIADWPDPKGEPYQP
jgi:Cytochrome c554 and c-prime